MIFVSSRSAWSIKRIPGQSGLLHRERLPQKSKNDNKTQTKLKQNIPPSKNFQGKDQAPTEFIQQEAITLLVIETVQISNQAAVPPLKHQKGGRGWGVSLLSNSYIVNSCKKKKKAREREREN